MRASLSAVAVWLLIFAGIANIDFQAEAAIDTEQALRMITETAQKLCVSVAQSGSSTSVKVSGDVKAEVEGLVKKLANLGITGSGQVETSSWEGLLQNELNTALKDVRVCQLKIFDTLQEKLIPRQSSATQQEGPAGIKAEGVTGLTVRGNILEGFSTGIDVKNSSDVLADANRIIRPGHSNSFPQPTGELGQLSNSEIRNRVRSLSAQMKDTQYKLDKNQDQMFEAKLDFEERVKQGDALHDEETRIFVGTFQKDALALASEMLKRTGRIALNEKASSDVQLGAMVIREGALAGPNPLAAGAAFLDFLAENLPR